MPALFWSIRFDSMNNAPGYLVFEDESRSAVQGVYLADGTPVPAEPAYSYTTTDMNPPPPSWAHTVVAVPSVPDTPVDPTVVTASMPIGNFTIFEDGTGLKVGNPDGTSETLAKK